MLKFKTPGTVLFPAALIALATVLCLGLVALLFARPLAQHYLRSALTALGFERATVSLASLYFSHAEITALEIADPGWTLTAENITTNFSLREITSAKVQSIALRGVTFEWDVPAWLSTRPPDDTPEPFVWSPITLPFERATLIDGQVRILLHPGSEALIFTLAADLTNNLDNAAKLPSQTLAAQVTLGPARLESSALLAPLSAALAMLELTGDLTATATLEGTPAEWLATVALPLTDWTLADALGDWRAEGLNSHLRFLFTSANTLRSDGLQNVRLRRLTAGDTVIEDLRLRFALHSVNDVEIAALSFRTAGGEITVAPFRFDPADASLALALDIRGIDMAYLSNLLPDWGIRAEGLLDGAVSLRIGQHDYAILPGHLEFRESSTGSIRYRNPGWLAGTDSSAPAARRSALLAAEEAFENLRIDKLRIELYDSSNPDRQAVANIRGVGRSERLRAEVPVDTTINLSYDEDELKSLPLVQFIRQTFFPSL